MRPFSVRKYIPCGILFGGGYLRPKYDPKKEVSFLFWLVFFRRVGYFRTFSYVVVSRCPERQPRRIAYPVVPLLVRWSLYTLLTSFLLLFIQVSFVFVASQVSSCCGRIEPFNPHIHHLVVVSK